MSEIFVTAAAPTRFAALAMMAALGVAKITEPRTEYAPGFWQWTVGEGEDAYQEHGPVLPEGVTGEWFEETTTHYPGGEIIPLVQVTIAEAPAPEGVNKSLWNFWYYGDSAEALSKPEPEGGWQPEHGLFERTYLLELIDQRTGIAPQWVALSGDRIPPGYEMPDGCRLYDPELIASLMLVKA